MYEIHQQFVEPSQNVGKQSYILDKAIDAAINGVTFEGRKRILTSK